MLIIGIDPGLQKTGWGLVYSKDNHIKFIASGLIKTKAQAPAAERLASLHLGLLEILQLHKPQTAAIEETFVNKNPASALKLGQARGILLATPAIYGIDVAEYSANKIKKSVVGAGHASKAQVSMMVKTLLPTCGELSEDEADALAVAITHAHYGSGNTLR